MQVGDLAPDLLLPDQDKVLALYLYPKDLTTVCTTGAMAFRQMHERFQAAGAEVIGVSSDDVTTHKRFAEEHELTFRPLNDEKDELRKAFGIGGAPRAQPASSTGNGRCARSAILRCAPRSTPRGR